MRLRRAITVLCPLALAGTLAASAASAQTQRIGLREAVDRALVESHLLKAGDHDVEKAGEGLRKARAQRILPKAEVNLAGGIVPEARGDVVNSPDSSGDLGPYYRVELKLVQPLWSFGKLDALEQLARHGVAAEEARRSLTRESVALDAAKAYWSLAAAGRGEAIAAEMRKDFDELLREVEKRLADENSGVDDADLLDVKTSAYGIERVRLEALEARRFAADALRVLCGLPEGGEPEVVHEPAPAVAFGEGEAAPAVARAVEEHREVRALAAAAQALAAKVELQRRSRNPLLFLAAGAAYAHASNRDDQDNPWVNDDFNYTRIGAELGMTWDANLHRSGIDVSEVSAEHRGLLERLAALRAKVAVDVRQALRAAARERDLLDAARASLKAAKSRLRLVLDTWETGLGEVPEVLDAYRQYYQLRGEEPQRELALNIALARLGYVLGDVGLYLGWVERGKAAL